MPKIVLTAFFGHTVVSAVSGHAKGSSWLSLVLIVALWIGIGLVARWWLKRQEAAAEDEIAFETFNKNRP